MSMFVYNYTLELVLAEGKGDYVLIYHYSSYSIETKSLTERGIELAATKANIYTFLDLVFWSSMHKRIFGSVSGIQAQVFRLIQQAILSI